MSLYSKLFEGVEGLPADFQERAETLLNAHINEAVEIKTKELVESHETAINEMTTTHENEILELKESAESYGESVREESLEESSKNLDKYMSHFLNEWATKNQVAIDSHLKVALAESFLGGFSGLLVEHNVELPAGDSILESVEEDLAEKTAMLNESTETIVGLNEQLEAANRETAFLNESVGLTATEIDRLRTMTADLELNESFTSRVQTIRTTMLNEDTNTELNSVDDGNPDGADIQNLNESGTSGGQQTSQLNSDEDEILAFMRRK